MLETPLVSESRMWPKFLTTSKSNFAYHLPFSVPPFINVLTHVTLSKGLDPQVFIQFSQHSLDNIIISMPLPQRGGVTCPRFLSSCAEQSEFRVCLLCLFQRCWGLQPGMLQASASIWFPNLSRDPVQQALTRIVAGEPCPS